MSYVDWISHLYKPLAKLWQKPINSEMRLVLTGQRLFVTNDHRVYE
jgi:hypothetical protein